MSAAGAGATLRRLLQALPLVLPQFAPHLSASSLPPVFVLNRAIEAFALDGFIGHARDLFEQMPEKNGGSWNAIISAYSRTNQPNNALSLFSRMFNEGVPPKDVSLASVLGSCSEVQVLDLCLTRQIHTLVVKLGFCSNLIINTSLVDIYGKCDVMLDAEKVFDSIPNPNAVSWNVIVRRYYELGRGDDAIEALFQMIRAGVMPLNFTISNSLLACADAVALFEGRQIHGLVVKIGHYCDINSLVRNCILQMYAKCGALDEASKLFDRTERRDTFIWTSMLSGYVACGRIQEAEKIFDSMPERNIISWNAMIGGYINCSAWDKALDLFRRMEGEIGSYDIYTLGAVIKAFAELLDLEKGRQVHGFAYRHNYQLDHYLCNALIGQRYFNSMSEDYGITPRMEHYECMIELYSKHGCMVELEKFVEEMPVEPTVPMWLRIFDSCREYGYPRLGKKAENFINKSNPLNPVRFDMEGMDVGPKELTEYISVSQKLKGKFYRTAIRPAMLYGAECWATKRRHVQKMSVAEMRMLRWICGHTRKDRIRNDDIRDMVGVAPIEEKLIQHRLRWFGHIQRRPPEAPVRIGILNHFENTRRGRGRPRLTWEEAVKRDLKEWNVSKELAIDRSAWKLAIHVPEP
ncbi:Pentatricopeptide repeat-containing protein [Rhynchospora pubera]|uniref:Pentatricopeptide repeat-containing protein n=1 Tax=Rhynchospora pubera TaxID=906938 RepID=A0AAV8CQC3_9POAL|nr:Pentatricopeptide repeat-containing protein [Rhynchospora pubera]